MDLIIIFQVVAFIFYAGGTYTSTKRTAKDVLEIKQMFAEHTKADEKTAEELRGQIINLYDKLLK